jgi:hypothetical protein
MIKLANKNSGVMALITATTAVIPRTVWSKKVACQLRLASIVSMSLEKRFNTRPTGVVSITRYLDYGLKITFNSLHYSYQKSALGHGIQKAIAYGK